jgi:prophage antirepressor-like protein
MVEDYNSQNMSTSVSSSIPDVADEYVVYDNTVIKVFGTYDEPFFCGEDIATVLKYRNPKKAVNENVNKSDRLQMKILIQMIGSKHCREFNECNLKDIYVNESGLLSLINGQKRSETRHFKLWITKIIIPELRMMGRDKHAKELRISNSNTKISTLCSGYSIESKIKKFGNAIRSAVITAWTKICSGTRGGWKKLQK